MTRPRIRSIKPELWADEKIGTLSRDARLIFIGLITMADDQGRLRAMPALILGHILPYDDATPRTLERWLGELTDLGLIVRYEVDGRPYIALPGWEAHQKINRANESTLPAPPVFTDRSVKDHGHVTDTNVTRTGPVTDDASPHARDRAPADRIGSDQEPPVVPPGTGANPPVKRDGRTVPAATVDLAVTILSDFCRQAGKDLAPFTGRGKPSDGLSLIIGALLDWPDRLTGDNATRMIRAVLSGDRWWDGPPTPNVVFGPGVVQKNLARITTSNNSAHDMTIAERMAAAGAR